MTVGSFSLPSPIPIRSHSFLPFSLDIQALLRPAIPSDGSIAMRDLPQRTCLFVVAILPSPLSDALLSLSVLEKVGVDQGIEILTADQLNVVRMYAESEPDLEITLEGLLALFAWVIPSL